MTKHIHIHLHRTQDSDGPAHAPAGSSKGGQFVSGSGGGGKTESYTATKKRLAKEPHAKVRLPNEVKHPLNAKHNAAIQKIISGVGQINGKWPKQTQAKLDVVYKAWAEEESAAKKQAHEASQKAPPTTLSHKGSSYTSTGKSGKHLSTGEDIHEYEQVDKAGQRTGSRVWRSASGKIHQD